MSKIKKGLWRHFKGNLYEVIGTARHSETVEEMVIYKALYESADFGKNAVWVRPFYMFEEQVTRDGKTFPRFTYLGPKPKKKKNKD